MIDEKLVLTKLSTLNTRKSHGYDGITPVVLKACAKSLSGPIATLFNHSIISAQVPSEWKKGLISPIYKGGIRSDVANYRPVTLLPILSKVLERLVTDRITQHIEDNKLLPEVQHGFRKTRSCLNNLLVTLDDWTKSVDQGQTVHACYLDMSKSFDCVNHKILIAKLENFAIHGQLLN